MELVNAKTEDATFKVEASVRLHKPVPTLQKTKRKRHASVHRDRGRCVVSLLRPPAEPHDRRRRNELQQRLRNRQRPAPSPRPDLVQRKAPQTALSRVPAHRAVVFARYQLSSVW